MSGTEDPTSELQLQLSDLLKELEVYEKRAASFSEFMLAMPEPVVSSYQDSTNCPHDITSKIELELALDQLHDGECLSVKLWDLFGNFRTFRIELQGNYYRIMNKKQQYCLFNSADVANSIFNQISRLDRFEHHHIRITCQNKLVYAAPPSMSLVPF